MNNYKIIGGTNFLFGLYQAIVAIGFVIFTLPRLKELYDQFDATNTSLPQVYLAVALVLAMATANFFLAYKLFSKSEKSKEKYLKYGIISIIVTFVLSGLFMSLSSMFAILPIYNLTTSL